MANRYWINTAGGNWSDSANWSTTSGGTGGASVPSSVDDVFINLAGTYTITLDVTANCLSLDFTGSTSVTLARGTNPIYIYGNLIYSSSTTSQSGSSAIYMKSTSTCSIDTKGGSLGSGSIYIDGVGGTFNLNSTFNSGTCDIYVLSGTFNTNNYNITCWLFNMSFTSTRSINFGSSIINITTRFTATTTTGLTFNVGTSTIKINGSSVYTSSLGNLTYYNFEINNTNHTISGSNTFNTLKINAGKTLKLTSGTTQTITNLDAIGTSGSIITIKSTTAGSPATISKVSGTVTVDYCSIQDIAVTGGATFNATNSTNVSGNTGWNFGVPITANTSLSGNTVVTTNGVIQKLAKSTLLAASSILVVANIVLLANAITNGSTNVTIIGQKQSLASTNISCMTTISPTSQRILTVSSNINNTASLLANIEINSVHWAIANASGSTTVSANSSLSKLHSISAIINCPATSIANGQKIIAVRANINVSSTLNGTAIELFNVKSPVYIWQTLINKYQISVLPEKYHFAISPVKYTWRELS